MMKEEIISYDVQLVDNCWMKENWSHIEKVLNESFENVEFFPDSSPKRPFEYTLRGMDGEVRDNMGHVVALTPDNKILAAFFCIPIDRAIDEEECDIGWFFGIPQLSSRLRIQCVNEVTTYMHSHLKKLGFKRIVTNMGTHGGSKYLKKKHGYIHTPLDNKLNNWVKVL